MQFALFFAGLLWIIASRSAANRAAMGLATRFQFDAVLPVLAEGFFLFLLAVGFTILQWIATRHGGIRQTNALPSRATAKQEWLRGAALGWGLLLLAVLPMVLAGDLHPEFLLAPRYWGLTVLSLIMAAFGTLALEVAFRGYVYRHLIASIGPTGATILMALLYAMASALRPNSNGLSFVVSLVAGLLFCMAYLRTHALWLGWGLHFAWAASMGILFGLPVLGAADYSTIVESTTGGADSLTGGAFGPDASLWTALVLLGGMIVLYRVTRDYAWQYTHPPIVSGGHPVTVQPPAAHTAMENAAPAPVPLVQIAMATPAESSTMPQIVDHLRNQVSPEVE